MSPGRSRRGGRKKPTNELDSEHDMPKFAFAFQFAEWTKSSLWQQHFCYFGCQLI